MVRRLGGSKTRTQVRELGPRDRSLLWSVLVCPGLVWSGLEGFRAVGNNQTLNVGLDGRDGWISLSSLTTRSPYGDNKGLVQMHVTMQIFPRGLHVIKFLKLICAVLFLKLNIEFYSTVYFY